MVAVLQVKGDVMPEKRMLIVDADVARKIEENRGDMTVSEFINFLIDSQLSAGGSKNTDDHVTKEEFRQFEQGMKDLLRSFLEFFLSYGLELGRQSAGKELEELSHKLKSLGFESKNR
jgi:hypothetical protein